LPRPWGKMWPLIKVLVFVIGAGMASVAGVMYAYYISFIDPTSFTVMESIFIIGGAGNIWGSVLAAVILVILPEALRFVGMPSAIAANMRQIIYGGLLVIFMHFRPQGFIGEYSFCICHLDQTDRLLFKNCTSYAHVLLCSNNYLKQWRIYGYSY